MNQGKIWLVVKPSVGLPAFLGGVTVIALCVHAAVLTKSDWYPAYYSGSAKVKAAMATTPAPVATVAAGGAVVAAAAPAAADTTVAAAKAPPGKK